VTGLQSEVETIEKINEEEEKAEVPEEDKKENVEMVEICGAMIPAGSVVGASQGSVSKVEPSLKDQSVIKCHPEPYIICLTEDESYLNCIEYNGVLLSSSYLSCTYVMS